MLPEYLIWILLSMASTLADKIRQGSISWRQSAQLLAEIAESVQFAHDKGFIHRRGGTVSIRSTARKIVLGVPLALPVFSGILLSWNLANTS